MLLFSISCKSKQDPKPSKEDLVGTWKSAYSGREFILNIDSEGNLIFNCGLKIESIANWHHNFAGKLEDTFEYPYTIELTFTASSLSSSCAAPKDLIGSLKKKSQIGRFTFHDASTLTASVIMLGYNGGGSGPAFVYWFDDYDDGYQTLNFKKQ